MVRTLLIDNYDSYTFNLFQQLSVINSCEPIVIMNDAPFDAAILDDIDNVVISPGPGNPMNQADFGISRQVIALCQKPILGVCLGHQGIVTTLGGAVLRTRPMHGQLSVIRHNGSKLFDGIPASFEAVRYHSLVVEPRLPEDLHATAWSEDGHIMALEAKRRPLFGVQFHPESCLTEYGDRLLVNFRTLTEDYHGGASSRTEIRSPFRASNQKSAAVSKLLLRVKSVPFACDAASVVREARTSGDIVWLDSVVPGTGTGRFSYIALSGGLLYELVTYDVQQTTIRVSATGQSPVTLNCSIFDYLDRRLKKLSVTKPDETLFDFCGGYVGWLGYECKLDCGASFAHESKTPDASFFFCDRLLAIDHFGGRTYVMGLCYTEAIHATDEWIDCMIEGLIRDFGTLETKERIAKEVAVLPIDIKPARDRSRYLDDIDRCFEFLKAGETYEVCLTNVYESEVAFEPLDAYLALRRSNPAPYAAFVAIGDVYALCSSPERFLRISDEGEMEARPIKGTARRDNDPVLDAQRAAHLARDPKERAENLMIVDLLRNDLGRVAEIGSVHVSSLMSIESFKSVHQMVSTIRARKRAGVSVAECVRACFPGGSITGAPKLRTMEIIDALEGRARGIYTGAIGYFSVSGAIDLNIVIRTLIYADNKVSIGAGGAITILSDPAAELEEVMLKATSSMNILNQSRVVL